MRRPPHTAQRVYTSPPALQAFYHQVWDLVQTIPRGKVATYGQLAALVPRPKGVSVKHFRAARARWVGGAMAACPSGIPWHRVINSQGKISIRTGNDHHIRQRSLLEKEGVEFDERGRIDLFRFRASLK